MRIQLDNLARFLRNVPQQLQYFAADESSREPRTQNKVSQQEVGMAKIHFFIPVT